MYERLEEMQTAYAHTDRALKRSLKASGLELLEVVSDFQFSIPRAEDQRNFYICRRPPAVGADLLQR